MKFLMCVINQKQNQFSAFIVSYLTTLLFGISDLPVADFFSFLSLCIFRKFVSVIAHFKWIHQCLQRSKVLNLKKITRMHSSRMHTAHSLTVSRSIRWGRGGVCPTPQPRCRFPPGQNDRRL